MGNENKVLLVCYILCGVGPIRKEDDSGDKWSE